MDRLVEQLQQCLKLPILHRRLDAELGDPARLHLEPQPLEPLVRGRELSARPGEAVQAHSNREDQPLAEGIVQRVA